MQEEITKGVASMTLGEAIALASIAVTILGIIVTVIMMYVKKTVGSMQNALESHIAGDHIEDGKRLDVLTSINTNITNLNKEFMDFKLVVSDSYVKQPTLDRFEESNKASHANLWEEIRKLNDKIIIMETKNQMREEGKY